MMMASHFGTSQVAEDYMDAEDLFHALRAQFKASALVDFHGTCRGTLEGYNLKVFMTIDH